jgi:hypothetical protein
LRQPRQSLQKKHLSINTKVIGLIEYLIIHQPVVDDEKLQLILTKKFLLAPILAALCLSKSGPDSQTLK